MNTEAASQISQNVHHGRNVKRLCEMLGVKQDTLAKELNLSQQKVSRLESKEELDDEMLNKIAKVLNVPVDAIKSYNDDVAVNIISNTFNEQFIAYQKNFNPIDKIMQLYEDNKALFDEKIQLCNDKIALYERLLKVEQDKNAQLEKRSEK